MTFTLTGETGTYVTFEACTHINFNTIRTVNTYVFSDDTDAVLDEGKSVDQIIIKGIDNDTFTHVFPVTSIYGRMEIVNDFMDDQETVTLSGMDDSYLNTDYMINNFNFNAIAGTPESYEFSITLERKEDRLPYSEL